MQQTGEGGPGTPTVSSLVAAVALGLVGPERLRLFLGSLSTLLIKIWIGQTVAANPQGQLLCSQTLRAPGLLLPKPWKMSHPGPSTPCPWGNAHASLPLAGSYTSFRRDLMLTIPPLEEYFLICDNGHTVNFGKQIK